MRRARISRGAIVLAGLALLGVAGRAEDPAPGEYAGDDTCGFCHEEVADDFPLTGHARAPGWEPDRTCETCHGPGLEHAESGGEIELIRPSQLSAREGSETCLACHAVRGDLQNARTSFHLRNEVGCLDCHSVHTTAAHQLVRPGAELCADCHESQVGQFDLPRSHPMVEGEEACTNCHDPHGPSEARMAGDRLSGRCLTCHFDKVGPYIYNHDTTLIDGCISCHQIHSSPDRHLLQAVGQVNLCYQCHPGTSTPGFHSAPTFVNEKCTACHTAIHGSNTNEFFLEE